MSSIFYFQDIYWREPFWLLLAFQPVLFFLLKKIVNKNSESLYAEKSLQAWVVLPTYITISKLIFSKNTVYIFAWLLFAIALAGPRIPLSPVDKEQFYGANIMLVVDLSRSMKATDIQPNRIRRAKVEIHELLEMANDHRIGVITYSARPHLFVPLTYDHSVLRTYLNSLENLSFPTMGSDPVSAILLAQQELNNAKGKSAIVLMSDGDFPVVTEEQLNKLQNSNTPVYVLGIGTSEGEAIPTKDGGWLKHNRQDIISKMNKDNLQSIASRLNGKYSSVYDDNSDWKSLYHNGIAHLNVASNLGNKQKVLWHELFPYFLLPSMLLFWFSLSIYRFKGFKNIALITTSIACMLSFPEKDTLAFELELKLGQTNEQAAYRAYMKGDYVKAEKLYAVITGYPSYIGQANSLYKMGHYYKAIPQYIYATLNAKNNHQRTTALYNLANSYFRTGNFSSAIKTYEDVLRYSPENTASQYNIKISQKLKKNIELRTKERERIISSMQGSGPRTANAEDGTDISENTSVSTDGDDKTLNTEIPLPNIPNLNNDTVKKLIISGLKNIRLAEQGLNPALTQEENTYKNIELLNVQQQANKLNDSQHLLWKRLFEIEEGFPAPVEQPHTLPGVNPW